jgi:hypothetical protein
MKSSIVVVVLATLSAVVPSAHGAPAKASVTVTITAEGTDMSGVVKSSRPAQCAAGRTVKVYKLVDGEPHLWASDTTDLQGGQYAWSTGNTGIPGRYYAKLGATPDCKADVSPTIRVRRTD